MEGHELNEVFHRHLDDLQPSVALDTVRARGRRQRIAMAALSTAAAISVIGISTSAIVGEQGTSLPPPPAAGGGASTDPEEAVEQETACDEWRLEVEREAEARENRFDPPRKDMKQKWIRQLEEAEWFLGADDQRVTRPPGCD